MPTKIEMKKDLREYKRLRAKAKYYEEKRDSCKTELAGIDKDLKELQKRREELLKEQDIIDARANEKEKILKEKIAKWHAQYSLVNTE
ncbi:unnamed protein product [Oikopleura dioica]|uniref:Uncharacterized protein n=1 Tax=Oikopleura dioica TaxID=34765 RepID=E4YNE7_OIKDI|nr:unnamed protein product [Oikopleura dioica]